MLVYYQNAMPPKNQMIIPLVCNASVSKCLFVPCRAHNASSLILIKVKIHLCAINE